MLLLKIKNRRDLIIYFINGHGFHEYVFIPLNKIFDIENELEISLKVLAMCSPSFVTLVLLVQHIQI